MPVKEVPKCPLVAGSDPGDQPVVVHHLSIALRSRSVHEDADGPSGPRGWKWQVRVTLHRLDIGRHHAKEAGQDIDRTVRRRGPPLSPLAAAPVSRSGRALK